MTAKPTHSSRALMRRLAVGSALAAALLAGTAAEAAPRGSAQAVGAVTRLLAQGQADSAIALGEKALAAKPQDSSLRAALGQAYLHAGRFASAVAALSDAVTLGDATGRTALGLALAQVANGQARDAVATLDRAASVIPAGDLGLAYALAGESAHGVSILADAVRAGGATPKLRQNLAYAYALDGRWTEARVTASMDVAADQIDSRLEQWAMSMRTGAEKDRIAALLGVPVRADDGMPAALALNAPTPVAPESAPAQAAAVPTAELPPVAPAPQDLAAANPAPAPVAASVSEPVVQPLPAAAQARAPEPAPAPRHALAEAPAAEPRSAGTHVVQLGAFSSAKNADRAVAWFTRHNPQIAGHKLVISQATVHGRLFWRVAAAGYDASGAQGTCSALRQSGGACFAHAADNTGERLAVKIGRSSKLARR